MPTGSPYFDSSSQVIDQSKKGLLDAVATGGTAGKQAFDAAQAQAAQAKQDAVARAAERSALYGVGGDNQTFLGAYDARANQMGVNRANFEAGLAQTQASGDAYLEKARGAIPVLQAVNANKVTDQETKIKTAIAAAQAKAQAEIDKENRADERSRLREDRADTRANTREDRADQRAKDRADAKAPKLPTANQLLGQGMTLADMVNQGLHAGANAKPGNADAMGDVDNAVFATRQMGGDASYGGPSTEQAARYYAQQLGMDEGTINGILTPAKLGAWTKASQPAKDEYAAALATKYAPKGVTPALAKSVVNGQDFQDSVTWLLNGADGMTKDEATAKLRDFYLKGVGRTGGNPGPWDAEFNILMGEYVPHLPTA